MAYDTIKNAKFYDQSSDSLERIEAFKQTLKMEYDQYKKENEQRQGELAERREQEYEEKIAKGVPFVDMPESRINDTSLGRVSKNVRSTAEIKNNKRVFGKLYDFYDGNRVIFTAKCENGVVTKAWYHTSVPALSTESHKSSSYSHEPSVDGFSNPEDFYDWYWDDFFDYYDAESYYYDHGGK